MNPFRDMVLGDSKLPILFEIAPPHHKTPEDEVKRGVENILKGIGPEANSIYWFIIPDLDPNEVGADGTIKKRKLTIAPREYAEVLKIERPGLEIIINRRTIKKPMDDQIAWLIKTVKMGYHNLVAVGGSSSKVEYPGPDPIRFAERVRELNNDGSSDIFLGGICIPDRGLLPRWYNRDSFTPNPDLEPDKMVSKDLRGIKFYFTQIVLDTAHIEKMYDLYTRKCEENHSEPSRIFICITPIMGEKNCNFIEWLGVPIPPGIRAGLSVNPEGIVEHSINYTVDSLTKFFDEAYRKKPSAKLGIYISCPTPTALGACVDLLGRLREKLSVVA